MKILNRTKLGNPILRKKSKLVTVKQIKTSAFKKLIRQMFFTIKKIGVGLAAPQIGKSIQLAVIDIHSLPHRPNVKPLRRVIINPKILAQSKQRRYAYEGCLSLEGVRGSVPRATWVKVSYTNEDGEKQVEVAKDFAATVFQHEIDHLNGVVYVDRMSEMLTLTTEEEFKKRILKRG
jgi:peptide deformylase